MRRVKLSTILCFSAMMLAAQSASIPTGIPAGAVKATDGYRYTDRDGHQWIYRPTPFGIVRTAATDSSRTAKAAKAAAASEGIRATDHGDTVSFERPGPFGTYRWERKKTDMDAAERAAFERQSDAVADRK
jgi:hypothetical protein